MPGQINKALAKTIGSAIDPLFLPEREGEIERERRMGRGWTGEEGCWGVENERERKKGRETSLISIPQPWTKR